MYLHARVSIVIEHQQKARHNFIVELLFKRWSEVRGHLTYGIASCIAHAWML